MYMSRGGKRKYFNDKPILGRIDFKGKPEKFYSRKEADDLFLKMMEEVDANHFVDF